MASKVGGADGSAPVEGEKTRLATLRSIAAFRHPHIIVMRPLADGPGYEPELSGGRPLSELLATHGGSLSLRLGLRILLDALSGLAALHHVTRDGKPLDFVHGELTPANIIVGSDGVARLVPLVRAHWSSASPLPLEAVGYTAPEKLLGDTFDQRADIFSAGVLLWEAMVGKSLFRNLPRNEVITHLVGGKVTRPAPVGGASWSAALADVVMRALAVNPADRWEQLGIMGADIETIAEGHVGSSAALAVLVGGGETSRDSFSSEVRPKSSAPSLIPISSSIPLGDDRPSVPGARTPTESALAREALLPADEGAASRDGIESPRIGMTPRRRRNIFVSAISLCLVLLAVAGLKGFERRTVSTASSTVLVPTQASPIEAPSVPSIVEDPVVAPEPEVQPPAPSPTAAQSRSVENEAKQPRAPPNVGVVGVALPASASSRAASAKPKSNVEDPFGLMKPVPVKAKAKDDPFGL